MIYSIIYLILGLIIGLLALFFGWMTHCFKTCPPPSRTEIDLLRKEARNVKAEDQPLKWMYVSDVEAELSASYKPKFKWNVLIMILGIVIIVISITQFIYRFL